MNQEEFFSNCISFGSIKVRVDLTKEILTNGQVHQLMARAIEIMKEEDLEELTVITTGYTEKRDILMRSYDCYPYGGQRKHYRLVNPKYDDSKF